MAVGAGRALGAVEPPGGARSTRSAPFPGVADRDQQVGEHLPACCPTHRSANESVRLFDRTPARSRCSLSLRLSLRRSMPLDRIQLPFAWNALEYPPAPVRERHASTGDKILDGSRHEHLP